MRGSGRVGWATERRWAFGCLLFAVLAFLVAYLEYDEGRLLAGAPTAPAVVTGVVHPLKGEQYLEVAVSLPDGRTVPTNISEFLDTPKKGGRIVVQYRPDGPGLLARQEGVGPDRTKEIGGSLVGIAALLTGVGLLVRSTRVARRTRA
jgi:hypothetical protein